MIGTKIGIYKGFEITVSNNGRFYGYSNDQQEAIATTYDDLISKLDKISKKEIRREVWLHSYNEMKPAIMTSLKEEESYGKKSYYARVSHDETWSQERIDLIFLRNEENDALAKAYNGLVAQALEIQKQASFKVKQMKPINPKELLESV